MYLFVTHQKKHSRPKLLCQRGRSEMECISSFTKILHGHSFKIFLYWTFVEPIVHINYMWKTWLGQI